MAKRKTRSKKKTNNTYQQAIIAFFILILTGLGSFQLGFLGRIVKASMRFIVGELYLLGFFLVAITALAYLLTNQGPNWRKRPYSSLLLAVPILALLCHAIQFKEVMAKGESLFAVSLNHFLAGFKGDFQPDVGGGIMGAGLYQVSYFILSQWGTYLLIFLAALAWLAYCLNISGQEMISSVQNLFQMAVQWLQGFINVTKEKSAKRKEAKANRAKKSQPEILAKNHSPKLAAEEDDNNEVRLDDDKNQESAVEIVGPNYQNLVESEEESALDQKKASQSQDQASQLSLDIDEEDDGEDLSDLTIEAEEENPDYKLPPVNLLNPIHHTDQSSEYHIIKENIKTLEKTLASFNVDAKVTKANLGPAVTKYEIEPAVGTKVSKITNLADDIALALAAKDIRIEAPIPGKSVIGIEVPNQKVSVVSFRDSFENQPANTKLLEVPLGRSIYGDTRVADLTKMPHLLIAGSTGSGKSVCINGMIVSILLKAKPNEVKLMMIDPKKVELNVYNGIPHLLTPVVTNPRKAAQALNKVVEEMERRYELFAATGQRNIDGYNHHVSEYNETSNDKQALLPYIVVIVDELADLMMVASKEVEAAITRLAQMARAAGIHMILATQRPSVDVITGIIKANVPSRIAFAVSSGTDSRTIIDQNGAEKLLGRGDMLFMPMGEGKPLRVQGAFITDEEVESVVDFVKDQQEANYSEAMMPSEVNENSAADDLDEMWDEVIDFVKGRETVSISMLQRQFRIGYNRAARLVDDMEARGIVSEQNGSKPRTVNISEKPEEQED